MTMDDAAKLAMVKALYGDEDVADAVVTAYLSVAGDAVLNARYPYVADKSALTVPDEYAMTQCTIASYLLSKRGAEGETEHDENGITRKYASPSIADIPAAYLSPIVPMCGVPAATTA